MGRTSDARERLVAAATELFAERAYNSVGVAEIATRAGVQKGSFYHFFSSKEALALSVVDAHWEWQRGEWEWILGGPGTALERLSGLFEAAAQQQAAAVRGTGSVIGCLFGNLALEVSSVNALLQQRLQEILEEQVDMIAQHLTTAVAVGEIDVPDIAATARSIVAQLEGLMLFAKLFNDPGELSAMTSLPLISRTGPAERQASRG